MPVALAVLVASGACGCSGRAWDAQRPTDPWVALLAVGTLLGLAVAHHQDAALLRFTGVVGALAVFYARGYVRCEREVG